MTIRLPPSITMLVALLTESVDWNCCLLRQHQKGLCRSPHGERGLKSIDAVNCPNPLMSLSSRRAWIEIWFNYSTLFLLCRRSPHGERGLKWFRKCIKMRWSLRSLSSRRAWIEIFTNQRFGTGSYVALLTESVDWNIIGKWGIFNERKSRSPHGERGLKSNPHILQPVRCAVALLTESVDWNFFKSVLHIIRK